MTPTRLRRPGRASRLVPTLLLLGGAWLAPAHAANVLRYVLPILAPGQPLAYDIYLDSSTEFPMRDEVIYLSIGGKQFLNSHYLQGGTLHTIVFRISQNEYQSLTDGAPTAVYYSQDDAADPSSQWNFGPFHKLPVAFPIRPTPISPISEPIDSPVDSPVSSPVSSPISAPINSPDKASKAVSTAHRGKK